MTDDIKTDTEQQASLSDRWSEQSSSFIKVPLFKPEELDIFTNKMTNEAFIFHGKVVDYTVIDHIEYHQKAYRFIVHYKDGRSQDLGVKAQWIIRPYIKNANEISIVRTENQKSVDGVIVPLIHTDLDL